MVTLESNYEKGLFCGPLASYKFYDNLIVGFTPSGLSVMDPKGAGYRIGTQDFNSFIEKIKELDDTLDSGMQYLKFIAAAVSPNGKYYAGIYDKMLVVIDRLSGEVVLLHNTPDYYHICFFSPDNSLFGVTTDKGYVILWDVKTWTLLKRFKNAHNISAVSFSPDHLKLLCSSFNNTQFIWSLGAKIELLCKVNDGAEYGWFINNDYYIDSDSYGTSGNIRIRSVVDGSIVKKIPPNILSAPIFNNDHLVFCDLKLKQVHFMNPLTFEIENSFAFNHKSRRLISRKTNNTVLFLENTGMPENATDFYLLDLKTGISTLLFHFSLKIEFIELDDTDTFSYLAEKQLHLINIETLIG